MITVDLDLTGFANFNSSIAQLPKEGRNQKKCHIYGLENKNITVQKTPNKPSSETVEQPQTVLKIVNGSDNLTNLNTNLSDVVEHFRSFNQTITKGETDSVLSTLQKQAVFHELNQLVDRHNHHVLSNQLILAFRIVFFILTLGIFDFADPFLISRLENPPSASIEQGDLPKDLSLGYSLALSKEEIQRLDPDLSRFFETHIDEKTTLRNVLEKAIIDPKWRHNFFDIPKTEFPFVHLFFTKADINDRSIKSLDITSTLLPLFAPTICQEKPAKCNDGPLLTDLTFPQLRELSSQKLNEKLLKLKDHADKDSSRYFASLSLFFTDEQIQGLNLQELPVNMLTQIFSSDTSLGKEQICAKFAHFSPEQIQDLANRNLLGALSDYLSDKHITNFSIKSEANLLDLIGNDLHQQIHRFNLLEAVDLDRFGSILSKADFPYYLLIDKLKLRELPLASYKSFAYYFLHKDLPEEERNNRRTHLTDGQRQKIAGFKAQGKEVPDEYLPVQK